MSDQLELAEACRLRRSGKHSEAEQLCRQLIETQPDNARAHVLLATLWARGGRSEEAAQLLRHALALGPPTSDLLVEVGNALGRLGSHGEAAGCFRVALRLRPNDVAAHDGLGVALEMTGDLERAIASYRKALTLRPANADAQNHLGNALRKAGRLDEAVAAHRRALSLRPSHRDAYNSLGVALQEQRKLSEALQAYRRAIALHPTFAEAHMNLGTALLLCGELAEGWSEYEWRWQCPQHRLPPRHFPQPLWDGSELDGRSILLQAEQGLGDTLQFCRYVPLVAQRGGKVILSVQRPLLPILRGLDGVSSLVPVGDVPLDFHMHTSLMSLPFVFGTSVRTIPAAVPYLRADPTLAERWAARLDGLTGIRVGVNWRSSATPWGRPRSVPLEEFAALAEIPGVRLLSLQKGDGADDVRRVPFAVSDLVGLDEESGPFMDTAAVIQNLDLVITSDTSIAHLAGALGAPVWVVLPFAGDWRWLLDREDTPWYPTMRLFRQPRPGDWRAVMERLSQELRESFPRRPT